MWAHSGSSEHSPDSCHATCVFMMALVPSNSASVVSKLMNTDTSRLIMKLSCSAKRQVSNNGKISEYGFGDNLDPEETDEKIQSLHATLQHW